MKKTFLVILAIIIVGLFIINIDKSPIQTSTDGVLRTANSNTYSVGGKYTTEISSQPINLKDVSGNYQPYEKLTTFSAEKGNLVLRWNNKEVLLKMYITQKDGSKRVLTGSELSYVNTLITKSPGSYYYVHNIDKTFASNLKNIGYDIETKNVNCKFKDSLLICGEQQIDFNQLKTQNLNIKSPTANLFSISGSTQSLEISGDDLSYIDPFVTLSSNTQSSHKEISSSGTYYCGGTFGMVGKMVSYWSSGPCGQSGSLTDYFRQRAFFDLSSIHSNVVSIDNVVLRFFSGSNTGTSFPISFYDIREYQQYEATSGFWDTLSSGNVYATYTPGTTYQFYEAGLSSQAASDMFSDKQNNKLFGIGATGRESSVGTMDLNNFQLVITYTRPPCTPSWVVGDWTTCNDSLQTRTVTDSNNCDDNTGKPAVSQSCVVCNPNWDCNSWFPATCPITETQSRTCIDLNSCNVLTGKPLETQVCDYTCTPNWITNDWSACVSGTQTRDVVDSSSCGDNSNRPISTQSCTVTCTPDWQIGNWTSCVNGNQTRSVIDTKSCGITQDKPLTIQSCSATCSPYWQSGIWSSCSNGNQSRTVSDLNNCGILTGKPATKQSCSITTTNTTNVTVCVPSWSTGDWNTCTGGTQSRNVTDSNNCNSILNKPAVSQTCTEPKSNTIYWVIGIGAALGLVLYLRRKR